MGSLPPFFCFFHLFTCCPLFPSQQTSKSLYPPPPPSPPFLILFVSLTFAFLFPSFYRPFYLSINKFSYTLFFPFHVFPYFFYLYFLYSLFYPQFLFPFFCFSVSDLLCKCLPFQPRFPVLFFIDFLFCPFYLLFSFSQ